MKCRILFSDTTVNPGKGVVCHIRVNALSLFM
jgi:hypothetical protein